MSEVPATTWGRCAGPSLIVVAFFSPLIGVSKRHPDVAHAITWEGFDKHGRTSTGACGARFLHPVKVSNASKEEEWWAEWPPQAKGTPWTRCRECFDLTPKKRPRTKLVKAGGLPT